MRRHTTFGIAAIIFSVGFLIHALGSAHALSTVGVSLGANPVFSHADSVGSTATSVTIPNQSGHELMISDIFIHPNSGYNLQLTFQTSSGEVVGIYRSYNISVTLDTHLSSPLRIPAGEDLIIVPSGRGVYTISGYKAHP